jgi:serine/threonine protein kinase/tetratricopeptide (TPR) repeat protein/TolB-like protein
MALTAAQMVAMSRLLDEALPLDAAGRERWLADLPPEHAELAAALRDALIPGAGDVGAMAGLDALPRISSGSMPNATLTSGLRAGEQVGPYELIRRLGTGGMAEVWLAHRADGTLKREVALKLPMLWRLRADLTQRFARERDILAGLEHTHIARLYDAGVSNDGLPYLALEYVEGQPLTAWCDEHRLGLRERLKLFLQVLDAVQYAHGHHVIHRDLKPSNILVTPAGQVRLLDFGVAKLLAGDEAESDSTELTQLYGRALTLEYASPEQLRGEPVDATSDIYSLGVVLYELLTGGRPYRLKPGAKPAQLEQAITTANVDRPSIRVGADAGEARATTQGKIVRRLRGDLDAIALKALAKDPHQRYASASALADDLQRHLSGEPVEARPDRLAYRMSKFVLRHRTGTAAAAAMIVVGSVAGVALYQRTVNRSANDAAEVLQRAAIEVAGTSGPSAAGPPAMSVAIAGFTAAPNDSTAVRLAEALPRELTTVLVAARHEFKVVGSDDAPREVASSTRAPRIAARYRTEGDVRSSKDGNSVNIRLIDATTGSQVWSTRFDLPDLDGSSRSSARMRKLTSLLANAVYEAETRRVLGQPLENLDAIELVVRGDAVFIDARTLEKALEAQKLYEAALRLNPNLVSALVSQALNWDAINDVDPHIDRQRLVREMDELTRRAVALDGTNPLAWAARSEALSYAGRWTAAVEANAKAIRLDPFYAGRYAGQAWIMNMIGRPTEALPLADHAISLDPDNPGWALRVACEAQMLLGRNDDAVATCEKAAGTNSDWFVTSFLVAVYANRGDMDKAIAAKNEILRTVPGYTIAQLRAKHYSDVPEYVKMAEATWYAGLRKAGIPEK